MMSLEQQRMAYVNELIRRVDTVTLLTCVEVRDLWAKAAAGEYDDRLEKSLTDAIGRHDLTHAELTGILAQMILQWNKYAIRDEREEESK